MGSASTASVMKCSRCGASIPSDAPEGFCLLCLVREGAASRKRASAPPPPLPNRFGDYEILGEIGRGGMGRVYRARQISLDRVVALKVIAADELALPKIIERFRTEAEAAASLDHPNIVSIYEVGEHDGWNYFSMRLVEGQTLGQALASGPLPFERAARLLAKVARAIQHAHERGVLHRDLKPANILLDASGEPHVADFGLAKFTQRESDLTLSHMALGTPAYMSPEQAAGHTKEITTAADVYGLGAVLYELLSGKPPFIGSSAIETMRRAADDVPAPLPGVPRDLRTICLKCLAKQPGDRYRSAAALADDLERFTRGEPVSAVPLTPLQTAWRWAKRRPQVATLIGLSAFSLVAGIVGISWQWRKAERARQGESVALEKATSTVIDLYTHSGFTAAKDGDPTRAALWFAKAAEAASEPARREENLARQLVWRNESHTAVRAFESDIGPILRLSWNRAQTALLGFAWDFRTVIWDVAGEARWRPDFEMESAAWANEADWLVSSAKGFVRLAEYPSGRELTRTGIRGPGPCLVVSRDDRWVAVGGESPFLWDWSSHRTKPLPHTSAPARLFEFSADGKWLLVCASNRVGICSLDAPGQFQFPEIPCNIRSTPAFLGSDLFCISEGAEVVTVRDTRTGTVMENYTNTFAQGEGFARYGSPGGRYIVTSMAPGIARPSGFTQFPIHGNTIEQADFTDDGSLLATACYDSIVRLVPLPAGRPVQKIGWHQEGATGVAISPDRRCIASAQMGGNIVRVWRLGGPPTPRNIPVAGDTSFRLSKDGRLLLPTGTTIDYSRPERTRVHDIATTAPVGPEIVPGGAIIDADFVPEGSWLALVCSDLANQSEKAFADSAGSGTLQFWDFRSGERLGAPIPLSAEPRGVCVHPSGRWVATYTAKRELLEIEVATRQIRVLHATTNIHPAGDVYPNGRCCYSPDGRFLAAWAMRMPALLWDRETETFLPIGTNQLTDVDFSGDIMSGVSVESRLDFFSLHAGRSVRPPLQDSDWLFFGRFSPEGDLFLTGGRGKMAHVWDWRQGTLKAPAFRHESEVFAGTFVPGTECVATGGLDRKIHFWDRRTGLPLRPPLEPDMRVLDLATTPDGRTLICGNHGNTRIVLYDVAELLPKPALSVADALLLAEIDAAAEIQNGGLEPLAASAWLKKWRQFRVRHPEWHRW